MGQDHNDCTLHDDLKCKTFNLTLLQSALFMCISVC